MHYCPVCKDPAVEQQPEAEDDEAVGSLYVAQEDTSGCSTHLCYDPSIKMFKCTNVRCETTFYVSVVAT